MQVFSCNIVTFLRTPFYRMAAVAASVSKTDQKKQKDIHSMNIFVETQRNKSNYKI